MNNTHFIYFKHDIAVPTNLDSSVALRAFISFDSYAISSLGKAFYTSMRQRQLNLGALSFLIFIR